MHSRRIPALLPTSFLFAAAVLAAPFESHAATITVLNSVSALPVAAGGDFTGDTGFGGFPGIYAQPDFSAAEKFLGQTVGLVSGFETVSGTPTGPLQVPAAANGVTLFASELQG